LSYKLKQKLAEIKTDVNDTVPILTTLVVENTALKVNND